LSDFLAAAVLLIGAFFMLVASIGLIRLPDVYSRMHAATKAATFGMLGILLAVILYFQEAAVSTHAILAIFFIFLTVPVAAHLIARAAYRRGPALAEVTRLDEYGPYLQRERSTSQPKNDISGHI